MFKNSLSNNLCQWKRLAVTPKQYVVNNALYIKRDVMSGEINTINNAWHIVSCRVLCTWQCSVSYCSKMSCWMKWCKATCRIWDIYQNGCDFILYSLGNKVNLRVLKPVKTHQTGGRRHEKRSPLLASNLFANKQINK